MTETIDPRPVSFGEFAFLADNYHWDNSPDDASARFATLIAQNQFPVYPDTLSIIICRTGSFSIMSGGVRLSAGPRDAIVTLGGQPIESVAISSDCRLLYFSGKSRYFNTQIDLDDANRILSTLIAVRLRHDEEKDVSPASGVNRTLLASFLENVRNNCRKERGIAFYSSLANLTPKYFSKQIHNLSGKSPGAIIEEYTMAEAKTLLASKKYSIKEVSNIMNFSSPSSFCKYFKAAESMTPGQYMKRNA